MPIPSSILDRIALFARNQADYTAPDYKEARLRQEFLDPLFASLGWDVANTQGYAEAYKEVVSEDALRIGRETKAPDYSFRIGGTRKFFVEAKKPFVNLKDDPEPAHQLRRYSWSAKLPLGIVTDFQEFAIYDTRIRPRAGDKAHVARIFYCRFEEYPEKWDEIAGIFAKESVLKGSFDRFASSHRGKRGTAEFDDEFLRDMEHWRDLLARNLALRNPGLTQRDLNFAVQRTLDRIVFLRIAEDRGIEPYGSLFALTAGPRIYPRLCEIFERADFRYNSGLFHFATEKGRDESPDRLTLGLTLDDTVLKEILGALYYPQSPYAFAVIPADILGHVYEQFLGKVIHLTPDHRARVEEKPEVRKAGGVYYTPTYIVDYIVRQTVGPLVEGRTPKQVEKLKILDPACGSGSFLLGAFEFLLDWHLNYYVKNDPAAWAKKKNPPVYETAPNAHGIGRGSGNWQLTTAERKRILVANLHGVDIDAQAVEVTKLSLLLKVLEGEARELQGKQLNFERVLPDLGNNIKCGNSLIGPDFYQQPNLPEFDDDARYKINAFDWNDEFKPIMDSGGFDAVIGNPPWIDIKGLNPIEVAYYFARYSTTENRMNVYAVFVERALSLLKTGGYFSFITPNSYLTQSSYLKLRMQLLERRIKSIVRLPDNVFQKVNAETAIFILENCKQRGVVRSVIFDRKASITDIVEDAAIFARSIDQDLWMSSPDKLIDLTADPDVTRLLGKISGHTALESFCEFCLGLTPYDKYKGHTAEQIENRVFHSSTCKGREWKPLLEGADIARYNVSFGGKEYIRYGPWLGAPREKRFFAEQRILVRQIISGKPPRIFAGLAEGEFYNTQIAFNLLRRDGVSESLAYLLGILNSALITFYHRARFLDATKDTFQKILIQDAKQLPVRSINFDIKSDRNLHDQLVALVERMLKLHADRAAAKSPDAQTRLEREIRATDAAIDRLVYQLYDLTDEEIALVEQATAPVAKPAAGDEPEPAAPGYSQAQLDAAHIYSGAKEDAPPTS